MNKDKHWLSNEITNLAGSAFFREENEPVVNIIELRKLVEQLDEPELPVIPQFVAETIEKYKKNDDSLGELLASVEHTNIKYYHGMEKNRVAFNTCYEPPVDLCETIARAWLDGYSIEKEKMYLIRFGENQYALKFNKSKIDSLLVVKEDATEFTEEEIKAINERYWEFREEVQNEQ